VGVFTVVVETGIEVVTGMVVLFETISVAAVLELPVTVDEIAFVLADVKGWATVNVATITVTTTSDMIGINFIILLI
jgi:hypothetical protein